MQFDVTIGNSYQASYNITTLPSWPASVGSRYHPPRLTAATMVGLDSATNEIRTYIDYYTTIGVQYFYFYFLMPLNLQSSQYINDINSIAKSCSYCFSICQWYSFIFYGPDSGPYHSSEQAQHNDLLYRLKAGISRKVKSDKPSVWIIQANLDDFFVVHHKYANMLEMAESYAKDTGYVNFKNIYFYLKNHENGKNLENISTYQDFLQHDLVHETDLTVCWERPKMMINVKNMIVSSVHTPLRMNGAARGSHTFYLHYIKFAKNRTIDLIKYPKTNNLSNFLNLPREYNATKDYPMKTY